MLERPLEKPISFERRPTPTSQVIIAGPVKAPYKDVAALSGAIDTVHKNEIYLARNKTA